MIGLKRNKDNFYPVPKPIKKTKKKKVNGYKDKPHRVCYYCGTSNAERHEVYGGASRQISIDLGFQLDLCPECHRAWHAQADELWQKRKEYWQQHFQENYEQRLIDGGITSKQARACWMKLIHKNYL